MPSLHNKETCGANRQISNSGMGKLTNPNYSANNYRWRSGKSHINDTYVVDTEERKQKSKKKKDLLSKQETLFSSTDSPFIFNDVSN